MGAVEAIKGAVLLLVGLAIGWVVASLYGDFVALPAAREAGQLEERAIRDKADQEAKAKAEAAAQAVQTEFAAIEAGYLQREAERSAQIVALEQALQEKSDDPPPTGGAACRVLIPRRVSDQLNRTGRAPGAALPAKPDAALPPGR